MNCCKEKLIKRNDNEKKSIINRIKRINGQVNGIQHMIENDRYCEDVLIQLAAVEKAIKSLATIILNEHLHTCIKEQVIKGNEESLNEIVELFKRFN